MIVEETNLDRVLLIKLDGFEDHREEYLELYNEKLYREKGIYIHFVEDDISLYGTLSSTLHALCSLPHALCSILCAPVCSVRD